jgi:malonyl-CoA/methylmalonyl-CoA synthetase
VVPIDGAELDGEQLVKALEPVLARFKLPRKIFIIDELPRNAMGKVQKNSLRESYD